METIDTIKAFAPYAIRWGIHEGYYGYGERILYTKWHWVAKPGKTRCGRNIEDTNQVPGNVPERSEAKEMVDCGQCLKMGIK